ncbi:MAG: hypothetical protein ACXWPM_10325, partial [Bdellovibrionota bacterium]
ITTTIANCLSGAMHPSGKFLMVETIVGGNTLNITPYTVNNGILTAGSAIAGGSLSAGSKPISTFDSTGSYYYVANSSNGTLYAYSVTSTTGALNLIASYTDASLTGLIGIAVDPSNKYVFVGGNIGGSTGGVATWTIGANGALTQANAFTAAGLMSLGVVFDPTGKFVYAADYGPSFNGTSIYAYSFNSSTGVPTALSPASYTTGTAPVVPIIVKVQQ